MAENESGITQQVAPSSVFFIVESKEIVTKRSFQLFSPFNLPSYRWTWPSWLEDYRDSVYIEMEATSAEGQHDGGRQLKYDCCFFFLQLKIIILS